MSESPVASPIIRAVGLLHHYGLRPVLKDVSLDVMPGELLAVMGTNGSGKTTLLALMAGLLWPARGHIEVAGMRRRSTEEAELAIRKRIYYLPADPWLPSTCTGREFLIAVARIYDVEILHAMDHADRLLQLFDLTEKGDSPISSLSTGQTKKVALAAALISEATILLLDEPFSGGLDPSGIQALKRVLQGMAQQDEITVVMTTPVPELVEEIADRVAVLKGGQLVAVGSPKELRQVTGVTGDFAEVFEQLVHADTTRNIQHYFEAPSE